MMKCNRVLALVLVMVMAAAKTRAEEPTDRGDLAPLARLVGEWNLEAKWVDGTPVRARAVYRWGLGGTIMTARMFVIDGADERQRYEEVMAWDRRRQSIVDISFSVDGAINEILVEPRDDDTLLFGWTPYHPSKAGKVRQTIRFDGKNRYVWIVERNAEGAWKQIMEGTWVRAPGDDKQ